MTDQSVKEYQERILRIIKYSTITALFFLLGGLTPYRDIFFGLALGTAISTFNLSITARKINKIGDIAVSKKEHTKNRPMFTGMLSRFALSILAIMFALEYPQYFNFFSTLIGLFAAQVIAIIDSIIHGF